MKIIEKQSDSITLVAEEPDDLWIAYNLISKDDVISTDTTRRVQSSSGGGDDEGKRKVSSTRVKLTLDVKVISTVYEKDNGMLRVKGKTVGGAGFHTLEIQIDRPFELKKKTWSSMDLDMLRQDCELAVITVDGSGKKFELYLVSRGVTRVSVTVDVHPTGVPAQPGKDKDKEKDKEKDGSSSSKGSFPLEVFDKYVDFKVVQCVVIVGTSTEKNKAEKSKVVHQNLISDAQKVRLRSVLDNKSRFVTLVMNNASVQKVLKAPEVLKLMKDMKTAEPEEVFKSFNNMLVSNTGRACYGLKNVETAIELMAVETMLLTDSLAKSSDIETRRKYEGLISLVKQSGGVPCVYSSSCKPGKELAKMTGVAAILRYPLLDLDYIDELHS